MNTIFKPGVEENYLGKETPKLNVMFFDIEVTHPLGYPTDDSALSLLLHELDDSMAYSTPKISMKDAEELQRDLTTQCCLRKRKTCWTLTTCRGR